MPTASTHHMKTRTTSLKLETRNPHNDWSLADASGAAGDPNPRFDSLVKYRAMVSVWRRLQYMFPQVDRIGGWRLMHREYVCDYVQRSGKNVGGQFGPENKRQWFTLARLVLESFEAQKAQRLAA
jgi:hypothetical protein